MLLLQVRLELDTLVQTAKSVSRSSRQRATSDGWCGTPPRSVSLGVAVVGCEDEGLVCMGAFDKFGVATIGQTMRSVAYSFDKISLETGSGSDT